MFDRMHVGYMVGVVLLLVSGMAGCGAGNKLSEGRQDMDLFAPAMAPPHEAVAPAAMASETATSEPSASGSCPGDICAVWRQRDGHLMIRIAGLARPEDKGVGIAMRADYHPWHDGPDKENIRLKHIQYRGDGVWTCKRRYQAYRSHYGSEVPDGVAWFWEDAKIVWVNRYLIKIVNRDGSYPEYFVRVR